MTLTGGKGQATADGHGFVISLEVTDPDVARKAGGRRGDANSDANALT